MLHNHSRRLALVALPAALLFAAAASAQITSATWVPMTEDTQLKQIFVDHSELKDPFSVQFRKVQIRHTSNSDGAPITTWCGELNAKNGMGAYSGWAPFYVMTGPWSPPTVLIVGGESASSHAGAFNATCGTAPLASL